MYIAILGRQPDLGLAELASVFDDVSRFSASSATFSSSTSPDITRLGGSLKLGRIIAEATGDSKAVSKKIVQYYKDALAGHEGKIHLGVSYYDSRTTAREAQKTGLVLKQALKKTGVSVRLIPNNEAALSTATSHHNKLGLSDNKIELLIVRGRDGTTIVAESLGTQNITAYAKRDQGRPKRDAFVGMLPPKLAQIIINLAVADRSNIRVLDPFCGTGVVLQEAALLGHKVYGTDLEPRMIDYSQQNLQWLTDTHRLDISPTLEVGDAMEHKWTGSIDAIACESYLGQAFSAPPRAAKLQQVRGNCNHIIGSFLRNLHAQLNNTARLCVAVPAWRDVDGRFTHLPLTNDIESYGYRYVQIADLNPKSLLYYRKDQVVARQLLVLEKV